MKSQLSVSNIAWSSEEEGQAAAILREMGVSYVEIAPSKKWKDPAKATRSEASDYRAFWKEHGISICAMQSLTFNRPDLFLFRDEANRKELLAYLKKIISLAGELGAGAMVFGSPKTRHKGDRSFQEALKIAIPFFRELGEHAASEKTMFCIEPNPPVYGCDFITTSDEGHQLVEAVNSAGFGLHLDIGGMFLAGEDVGKQVSKYQSSICHFHLSAPQLAEVRADAGPPYTEALKALKLGGYSRHVSVEMRSQERGSLDAVRRVIGFAQDLLEDLNSQ